MKVIKLEKHFELLLEVPEAISLLFFILSYKETFFGGQR